MTRASASPLLPLGELLRLEPDFERVPYSTAARRRVIAGRIDGARCVVVHEAAAPEAWDWLQGRVTAADRIGLAPGADFDALLERHGAAMRALGDVATSTAARVDDEVTVEELSLAALAEEPNPVVRTLGSTLFDAHRSTASDIHIESAPGGAAIKYRIDGVLVSAARVDGPDLAEQLISRIKVLARLDVGERRLPQDGRFKVRLEGREVDLRVSIIPSVHGEDAVLRLLDRRALTGGDAGNGAGGAGRRLDLDRLGLAAEPMAVIRELARRPHGMLLVTGPTGSGKTTTLYAALTEINDGRQKVITIEDPVEYQLPGTLQVPVNDRTGLTFARGLRAVLRHDPDVVLVGEIRDEETAQIAVQAALTGHLVFSSIHANGAIDVVGRFMHMGVDPYNFTSALNGVVAQRLVRLNCARCAEREAVPAALRARAHLDGVEHGLRGRGCGECRGTGYRGRVACAEVLALDDDLREAIVQRAPPRELRRLAQARGMSRLGDQAAGLVAQGRTSIEEYARVAQVD